MQKPPQKKKIESKDSSFEWGFKEEKKPKLEEKKTESRYEDDFE